MKISRYIIFKTYLKKIFRQYHPFYALMEHEYYKKKLSKLEFNNKFENRYNLPGIKF